MFIDLRVVRARNILQHYGGVSRDVANSAIAKLSPEQIDLVNEAKKEEHPEVARVTLTVLGFISMPPEESSEVEAVGDPAEGPKGETLATPEQPTPIE